MSLRRRQIRTSINVSGVRWRSPQSGHARSGNEKAMASGKRASGAMYSGVPQRVLQPDAAATSLLKPQSHSFSVGLDAPGSTCSRMLSSCGTTGGPGQLGSVFSI